jgi:hypothetical protein
MVNNHVIDDSHLSVSVGKGLVDGALACLDMFSATSGVVVSDHKTNYWLVVLDAPLDWILVAWNHIWLRVIVRYLGIPFGVGLLPIAMWDWCLQRFQNKLNVWHHKDLPIVRKLTVVGCILQASHIYYASCWFPSRT